VDLINHFLLANVYSARKKELKNKQKEEERRRKEEEKAKQVLAFVECSFGYWETQGLLMKKQVGLWSCLEEFL
jgi:hypothetical protein